MTYNNNPNIFKFFLNFYSILHRKEKLELILIGLLIVFSSAIELTGIGAILPLVKSATEGNPNAFNYFLIFSSLLILSNIFNVYIYSVTSKFSWQCWVKFSSLLIKSYITKNKSFYFSNNSDQLIKSITHDTQYIGQHIVLPFLGIIAKSTIIISVSIYLIYINYLLTFILMISIFIAYKIFQILYSNKIFKLGLMSKNIFDTTSKLSSEAIRSSTEINLYNKSDYFVDQYSKIATPIIDVERKLNVIGNLPRYFFEIVVILLLIIVITIYHYYALNLKSDLAIFSLYAIAGYRCLPLISHIFWAKTTISSRIPGIIPIFETIFNNTSKNLNVDNNQLIKINSLSFGYNKKIIIENLSFVINENDKVLIAGRNGSGKSTLINLLLNQLNSTSGEILYNQIFIDNNNLINISYVSQHIFLIDASVQDNIIFGEKLDIEKLNFAVNNSGFSTICNTNLNLNTVIGHNGSKLSGGQKQIIAIARALYRKPKLLILDEATNAMDTSIEKIVIDKINDLNNLTLIIISHKDLIKHICNKKLNL